MFIYAIKQKNLEALKQQQADPSDLRMKQKREISPDDETSSSSKKSTRI